MVLRTIMMILGVALAGATQADTEKKGFWWYESPPQATEPDDRQALPPLPSPEALARLHPEELERILDARLNHAIWIKTPEAVHDYFVVQDVVRRNALAFTALTKYVLLNDADLNVRAQYPITPAGRKAATRLRAETLGQLLAAARNDYALILFSTDSCPYCPVQRATLKRYAEKHQWTVQSIDIDESPAAQARFDITVTPMTILIERGSERWLPVAVGIEALPVIEDNAYRAVRLLRGEITPQQFILAEYNDGGFFDPVLGDDDEKD